MVSKKIACLGGGSLYFPRALGDFALCEDLKGWEVVLYDIDDEKAELMASLGRKYAQQTGTGLRVRSVADLAEAVDGADFAITSIGGSGAEVTSNVYDSYYHNADMYIPAKYGVHQVIGDTCGPAGMMMGLRSIPAYLNICREIEKRCPKAVILNHSNPMAAICRAMRKYTDCNFIGICHGVQAGIGHVAEIMEISPQELECQWVGTNHYYWFTSILHNGQDIYPDLMARVAERKQENGRTLSNRLSTIYGHKIVYPEDDHVIEFYSYLTQVGSQRDLPYGLEEKAKAHGYHAFKPMPERAGASEEVRSEFFANYKQILENAPLPEVQDNTITGEGIASIVSAIASGRREVCIVNIPNNGIVPNLSPTGILEVEGVTDSKGVRGIQGLECPLHLKGILEKRFVWQELVADAAVKGDRNLALQALVVDEMSIVPEKAEAMLDELLEASKDLLPQF